MQPKRNARRKLILTLGMVLIVVAALLLVTRPKEDSPSSHSDAGGCLSEGDYKDLTGTAPAELDTSSGFHTYAVEFNSVSVSYSSDTSPNGQAIIKNIGSFYQSHKHKSILITLSSISANSTGEKIATERLQKIKAELVAGGVSDEAITIDKPLLADIEPGTSDIATISISKGQGCQ